MATRLTDVDPALDQLGTFAKATGNIPKHVHAMREGAIFKDGALPAKFKTLAALLWSVSSRCEPCIRFYAARARELGATDAELGEALAIAPALGACVAETWALKAFHAAHKESGDSDDSACCD